MANDIFTLFSRLPAELQVEIWGHTIPKPAFHTFQLGYEIAGGRDKILEISPPTKTPGREHAAWVETHRVAQTCTTARKVALEYLGKESIKRIWAQKKSSKRGGDDNPSRLIADISPTKDVICLTFNRRTYDLDKCRMVATQKKFSGLENLAIDVQLSGGWPASKNGLLRPLTCLCAVNMHRRLSNITHNCPREIIRLIGLFRDMKKFYFVVRVAKNSLRKDVITKMSGKNADEILQGAMTRFKEYSNAKNYIVYHDGRKPYYEVDRNGTVDLEAHDKIWEVVDTVGRMNLEHADRFPLGTERTSRASIKFSVLVCRSRV